MDASLERFRKLRNRNKYVCAPVWKLSPACCSQPGTDGTPKLCNHLLHIMRRDQLTAIDGCVGANIVLGGGRGGAEILVCIADIVSDVFCM